MLSKIEKELNALMRAREVDQDTRIGVILTLDTGKNLTRMFNWIKNNEFAGQNEIMNQLDVIIPVANTGSFRVAI